MAPIAYVSIKTENGAEKDVLKSLKEIPGVKKAAAVYGMDDIIATVHEKTMDELKETVVYKIKRVDKVRSTQTSIVVEDSAFSRNEKGELEEFKV